ncbi:hypothetical protein MKZ20_17730 [Psychrobacillus sp. FSL K6-2684]|uniref:hypothetical protein n=1 Tax=unclassified Psychrobacillus TaxID=2636677 RepID=UPI0030F736B6
MANVQFDLEDLSQIREIIREEFRESFKNSSNLNKYPPTLTRKDLSDIFQVEQTAINKLVSIPTFPKFQHVKSRYPRDLVLEWIEKNSTWVETNTNHYSKVI